MVVGTFRVAGHPGLNRVPFTGRFRGRALPPGTYTVSASAARASRKISLGRVTVVIVPPNVDTMDARRQRSTCQGPRDGLGAELFATTDAQGGSGHGTESAGRTRAGVADAASAEATGDAAIDRTSVKAEMRDGRILGVLPNLFEDAPGWLQPFLFVPLAAAILLLLLAAVPAAAIRTTGAATALVERRADLALTGATLLAVVALAALLL